MTRKRSRILTAVALMLATVTLSGCGCGPFGLRYCHGYGGYHGGRGYDR